MRKQKVSLLAVLAATCLLAGTESVALADDSKADIVQLVRQQSGNLSSLVVDKTMTFKMTPDWYKCFLDTNTYAYQRLNLLAICMERYGHHSGGDDIEDLDQAGDASSPLVIDAVNRLAENVHCTFEFLEPIKAESKTIVLDNLKTAAYPIGEKGVCAPKSHKLNVTYVVDSKAKTIGCTMSKDGSSYRFTIPTTTHIEAGAVEQFFRKGL